LIGVDSIGVVVSVGNSGGRIGSDGVDIAGSVMLDILDEDSITSPF
jgi:hypothetical protein